MNKKAIALILGLMANMASVCCAIEQEPTVQRDAQEIHPTAEAVIAPAAATPSVEPVSTPESEVAAPEVPVAPEIKPEEELTEEQLKVLLDQIIAEVKKEEEAKKAQAQAAAVQ